MNPVEIADRSGTRIAFLAEERTRILLAGLAAGYGLPHECASGTCGACRATVVSGEVGCLWPEAPGRKLCRGPSDILMCQSVARGPVSLALRGAFGPEPAPPAGWRAGTLTRLDLLTADIATLRIDVGAPFTFAAGQFVLVEFPGIDGARAYSMIRSDGGSHLDLLIRRLPGGAVSAVLFGQPVPARLPVRIFGPLGRAVLHPGERRPLVLIAGGSGIAGLRAILAQAEARALWPEAEARLFFGLRSPQSAFWLDDLEALAARSAGGCRVTVAFSETPADTAFAARYPSLDFAAGFVHEVAAACLAAEAPAAGTLWFVAGPPPLVDAAIRHLVVERKVSPTEIRYDRFG